MISGDTLWQICSEGAEQDQRGAHLHVLYFSLTWSSLVDPAYIVTERETFNRTHANKMYIAVWGSCLPPRPDLSYFFTYVISTGRFFHKKFGPWVKIKADLILAFTFLLTALFNTAVLGLITKWVKQVVICGSLRRSWPELNTMDSG